jgi:hypothetical protein
VTVIAAVAVGHIDTAAWLRYGNDEHGPIRRDLERRTMRVLDAARTMCPRRTGKLAATGRKQPGLSGERPYIDVTFGHEGETPYLGYVLYGTSPHMIAARNDRPNPHLRFVVGGMVVFAKAVHHPGTRANNFLERALPAAAG